MLEIFKNILIFSILVYLITIIIIAYIIHNTHNQPIYEYRTKIRFANAFKLEKLKNSDKDQLPDWLVTSKNVQIHFENNFLKDIYIKSDIDDSCMIARPGDFIVLDEEDRIWSCSYAWFHDNYERI